MMVIGFSMDTFLSALVGQWGKFNELLRSMFNNAINNKYYNKHCIMFSKSVIGLIF